VVTGEVIDTETGMEVIVEVVGVEEVGETGMMEGESFVVLLVTWILCIL
jgi:hypothetical protein